MARHIDLYQAFNLNPAFSPAELGQQLSEQLLRTDPANDRLRGQLEIARAILGDPTRRAAYDRRLADPYAEPMTPEVLGVLAAQQPAGPGPTTQFAGQQAPPPATAMAPPAPMAPGAPMPPGGAQPQPGAGRGTLGKRWLVGGAAGLVLLLVLLIAVIVGTRTDSAQSNCADIVFIGAAGSGQRSGEKLATDDGMGELVNETYKNLLADANAAGLSVERRVVEYPAAAISTVLSAAFKTSIETGVTTASQMLDQAMGECKGSKIVASGYSQGAMVMNRALREIEPNGSVAAVLIADGDRLPEDPNVLFGGDAAALPGIAFSNLGADYSGVGQAEMFSSEWRGDLLSWCARGDTICSNTPGKVDFDFGAGALVHTTGYNANDWRSWLKEKVIE